MQGRIRHFVAEYNRRRGATILLTSHYMDDVVALCKRVIVIHHGHLLYDGALAGLAERMAPYKLIRVTLGESELRLAALDAYGEIVAQDEGRVTLRVPREDAPDRTARLGRTARPGRLLRPPGRRHDEAGRYRSTGRALGHRQQVGAAPTLSTRLEGRSGSGLPWRYWSVQWKQPQTPAPQFGELAGPEAVMFCEVRLPFGSYWYETQVPLS